MVLIGSRDLEGPLVSQQEPVTGLKTLCAAAISSQRRQKPRGIHNLPLNKQSRRPFSIKNKLNTNIIAGTGRRAPYPSSNIST
jgi:hypothetical protein